VMSPTPYDASPRSWATTASTCWCSRWCSGTSPR
jgi:hypothetical protein